MGFFSQLLPPNISSISYKAPMYIISSDTCGPHRPPDPLVMLLDLMEVDQASEHPSPPILEDISSLVVS